MCLLELKYLSLKGKWYCYSVTISSCIHLVHFQQAYCQHLKIVTLTATGRNINKNNERVGVLYTHSWHLNTYMHT